MDSSQLRINVDHQIIRISQDAEKVKFTWKNTRSEYKRRIRCTAVGRHIPSANFPRAEKIGADLIQNSPFRKSQLRHIIELAEGAKY